MANFGPAGWAATLDGLSADQETIQAAEGLPRITRFGGITPEGLFVDLTALGDAFENEGPIGVRRIPRFLMEGFADDDADSAYQRIGEPAAIIAYPARTLIVTHRTGFTQQLEVRVAKNDLLTELGRLTMFRAEFTNAARATADYVIVR